MREEEGVGRGGKRNEMVEREGRRERQPWCSTCWLVEGRRGRREGWRGKWNG